MRIIEKSSRGIFQTLKFLRPEKSAALWAGNGGVLGIARDDEFVPGLAVVGPVTHCNLHRPLQKYQKLGFGVVVGGINTGGRVGDAHRIKPLSLDLFCNPVFVYLLVEFRLVHSSSKFTILNLGEVLFCGTELESSLLWEPRRALELFRSLALSLTPA